MTDEQAIRTLYEDMYKAMIAKDTVALGKILFIAMLLPLLLLCGKESTEPVATSGASIPPEGHQESNTEAASDGKTIIPFGTHGGSGIGSYTAKLKEHFPEAEYLEALGISGAAIRNSDNGITVKDWLKKIGFENKRK